MEPPPNQDRALARLRSVCAADSLGHRLVIGRQVGAGGMGRVFEAVDEASGRTLAVKLVQHVRGDGDLTRFTAEAEILESLDHPAIVAYVSHGTTPAGEPYLAMEWLEGEDLGRRLERGPLSVAEAVALGRRLADGLSAAHGRGVIHRDLKPTNIVLVGREVGRATIVDFGIARGPRGGGGPLTRTGELLGTPGYMAPSRSAARAISTGGPICSRSAACSTTPSPDGCRSRGTR
jgi:eukaryotic-like serine/threonine-protein kinase